MIAFALGFHALECEPVKRRVLIIRLYALPRRPAPNNRSDANATCEKNVLLAHPKRLFGQYSPIYHRQRCVCVLYPFVMIVHRCNVTWSVITLPGSVVFNAVSANYALIISAYIRSLAPPVSLQMLTMPRYDSFARHSMIRISFVSDTQFTRRRCAHFISDDRKKT